VSTELTIDTEVHLSWLLQPSRDHKSSWLCLCHIL